MFSYVDLVRVEIAVEVENRFDVTIPEEVTVGWRTLGDVARAVVSQVGGSGSEVEVFDWLRNLIAEGYGVSAELTPDEEVFDDYDRMTSWFMATPYPNHLGDRWFVRQGGGHSKGPAESGTAPKTAA